MLPAEAILGTSPKIWLEALYNRLVEADSGRGGLGAILAWLENIDFIPELQPLRTTIKNSTVFYEAQLAMCDKEQLKRPLSIRENVAVKSLGYKCPKCGFKCSLQMASDLDDTCSECGGELESLYAIIMERLREQGVDVSPETILIFEAYDRLAEAFICAYKALRLVLVRTAEILGWPCFRIEKAELRAYLDEYRMGRLAGETRIPPEEKKMLQFLVFGNLAGIPPEEAEQLLRLGIEMVKYGYIFQQLRAIGAENRFFQLEAEYDALLCKLNEKIRLTLFSLYAEAQRRSISVSETLGGYYAPCLLMSRQCWQSGRMAEKIVLEPVFRMPIFPTHESGALQAIFAPLGQGKTFLLSAIACYTILQKRGVVFSFLNDESNSFIYACMPLFGYSKRTRQLIQILKRLLGVEPQGVPTVTLTVLRMGEVMVDNDPKNPPTIYDRIVRVRDPRSFRVDFNEILAELKEAAENYGFSKPVGLVNVRNLKRLEGKDNIDAQVTSSLLTEFSKWRKSHLNFTARIVLDEISYIAPVQAVLYASDALHSGQTISDIIKESRRDNVAVDYATQRPLEIPTEFREASNIFFRNLPMSKDKARSQIDFLMESLQLEDPTIRSVIRDMNNRGSLGKAYWFWYNQPTRKVDVVRPCPPTFCLQDKSFSARELFRLYEKHTGEKILLDSWKQVKTLEAREVEMETEKETLKLGDH